MNSPTVSISVITVTLNCADLLPALVQSLSAQIDQDFEWVVVDGGSTDKTLDIAGRFLGQSTIVSGHDFGIYDALNKGVALATGDYYLVIGADDRLYPDAISNFRKAVAGTQLDIVVANVDAGSTTLTSMKGRRWMRGGNAFAASHAVGTLIRKRLHDTCGQYSNRYVNCADMHFILTVADNGFRIGAGHFSAGRYGDAGVSTVDRIGSISDAFRIQIFFGENKVIQLLLYIFRLFRTLFLKPRLK